MRWLKDEEQTVLDSSEFTGQKAIQAWVGNRNREAQFSYLKSTICELLNLRAKFSAFLKWNTTHSKGRGRKEDDSDQNHQQLRVI